MKISFGPAVIYGVALNNLKNNKAKRIRGVQTKTLRSVILHKENRNWEKINSGLEKTRRAIQALTTVIEQTT